MRIKILMTAILCSGMASLALAQTPTGTISGHVIDESGGAMPGVTITAGSPNLQGERIVVTTENGDYLIPLLPPGSYTVRFEVSGFQTVTRTLGVAGTQTVPIDVTMAISPLAETVSVVGTATPFVETAQVATTFKQDLIATLPSNRTLDASLLMAPAIHATGPAGAYSINGAMSAESQFTVNGVVITENVRGQPFNLYIEDALQEVTISTSGISAEYGRFGGGVINAITKSGGNRFSGSYRQSFNNDDWRTTTPFNETKLDKVVPTYEYTFGGPVLRDHLWFFTAGRLQKQESARTLAVTAIPYIRTNDEKRYEVNGTYSPNSNHTAKVAYLKIDNQLNNVFQAANIMDMRSLTNQRQPQDLLSLHYSGVITPRFFFEAQFSQRHFTFEGVGATSTDLIEGTLLIDRARGNTFRYWASTFCGVCDPEDRDNSDVVLKGSYFLSTSSAGAHNIVVGYDLFNDHRFGNFHQSGSDYRILGTTSLIRGTEIFPQFLGNDTTIIQWNPIGLSSQGTDLRTHSAFVNDQWRYNDRFSFNLGLRFDKNAGHDAAGNKVSDSSNVSPRLAAIFDPKGNGMWSASASYARYVNSLASGVADVSAGGNPALYQWFYQGPSINPDPTAPALTTSPQAIRALFDWFLANGGTNRPFLAVDLPGVSTKVGDSLQSPNVNEYSAGLSRQLGGRGTVRADFVYRDYADFYAQLTDLSTGRVRDPLGTAFDLTLVENTEVIDRKYKGLTLSATYRLGSRLDLGSNYTVSRSWGNFDGETSGSGPVTSTILQYPEYREARWNLSEGDLSIDQRHRVRLWGTYDVPMPRVVGSVNLGVVHQFNSGVPYGAVGQINPRPFVTNPGYATPLGSGATVDYWFLPRDAFRTEGSNRTDLAINYGYRIPAAGQSIELFAHAEVLNLFNVFDLCGCGGTVFQNGGGSNLALVNQGVNSPGTAGMVTFNPFTQTPVEGVNWSKRTGAGGFGTAVNQLSYTTPRTFRFNVGVRF